MSLLAGESQTQQSIGDGGVWCGMSASELKGRYADIFQLGTLSKASYIIELEPYDQKSKLKSLPLFRTDTQYAQLRWLATTCSIHVLQADTDSVKAGHYQHNYVTGNSEDEISINFIETSSGDIYQSASAIKKVMFHEDGSQGLPAEYAFWLTVSVHLRENRSIVPIQKRVLVCLSSASLDLDSQGGLLELPLTFVKIHPMMPDQL